MTHRITRFGPFELDLDNAELKRAGQVVKLPPQPFKALQLLVSRPGGLVTRDELREALWGNDSYVDFTAGVNFCMAQLRAALEDPASRSTFIVTVPRRGYKFVAPIEEEPGTRAEESAEREARVESVVNGGATTSRGRQLWVLATAAGLAAVAVWTAFGARAPEPRATGNHSAEALTAAQRRLAATEKFAHGALALADSGPQELLTRVGYFQDAIAVDPTFADAYASLADAKLIIGNYRVEPPQVAYAAARAAAARALELEPDNALAHATFGAASLYFEWDWTTAEAHLARAVAIDDSSARAHQWYSRYLAGRGQHDEALVHAQRAVDLAPGLASARTDLGMAAFYAGRFDEAIAICDEAAGMLPALVPAHLCAAGAAAEAGSEDLAVRYQVRAMSTGGDALRAAAERRGLRGFWQERVALLEAGMTDEDCERRAMPLAVALSHTGRTDAALDWLERAANRRTDLLIFAGVHPGLRRLHGLPRFTHLLQRVGLAAPSRLLSVF